ncbi:MAG TPA: TIGR02117 family protein [Burkholderiaceae bacterium]|nr:TIGR02117 family protein [Burkholderiaceae bacterium]
MNRRLAAWCAGLLPGLACLYVLLAGALGAISVNRDFRPTPIAAGGIPIYLRTNGVHAEIVVPTHTHEQDWRALFPVSHMRAIDRPAPWIAFGWGDRAFMLETPAWRDIRLGTGLRALVGLGPGAMHVEYVTRPDDYAVTRLQISARQYTRLVEAIKDSFRRAADGTPIRIDAPGYSDADAFYEAIPVYSPRFTCNEWVRSALSDAGLPMPVWAPFERTLFWHLP